MQPKTSPVRLEPELSGYFARSATNWIPLNNVRTTLLTMVERRVTDPRHRRCMIHYYGLEQLPRKMTPSDCPADLARVPGSTMRSWRDLAIQQIAKGLPARPGEQLGLRPVPHFRRPGHIPPTVVDNALCLCVGEYHLETARAVRAIAGISPREKRIHQDVVARAHVVLRLAAERISFANPTQQATKFGADFWKSPEQNADQIPEVARWLATHNRDGSGKQYAAVAKEISRLARRHAGAFSTRQLSQIGTYLTRCEMGNETGRECNRWLRLIAERGIADDYSVAIAVNVSVQRGSVGLHSEAERAIRVGELQVKEGLRLLPGLLPNAEHADSMQQLYVARGALAMQHARSLIQHKGGAAALDYLAVSLKYGLKATSLAHTILTKTDTFPSVDIQGKPGRHGGDLVWSWQLGAIVRAVSPLAMIQWLVTNRKVSPHDVERLRLVEHRDVVKRLTDQYRGQLDTPLEIARWEVIREILELVDEAGAWDLPSVRQKRDKLTTANVHAY